MRRFHGFLIARAAGAARPRAAAPRAARSRRARRRAAAVAPARPRRRSAASCRAPQFCLQAGLPHWTFTLADGVRLERSVFVPHGQNTVHVRYRLTRRHRAGAPAHPPVARLPAARGAGDAASSTLAYERGPDLGDALRVHPRRIAARAADAGDRRARRLRRRAARLVSDRARASSAIAATTT